eukprot:4674132-Amphidinium_carterae.1
MRKALRSLGHCWQTTSSEVVEEDLQNHLARDASARREAPGVPRRGRAVPLPRGTCEFHSHAPRGPSPKGKSFGSFARDGKVVRLSA